jgi:Zn finger protein HypA/HybF involved in hydrogenase expression
MHDFLLAKEIIDELKKIAEEKKLGKIKSVSLEIGTISLAHDGFGEHAEDVTLENLEFGLKSLIRNTPWKGINFKIKKADSQSWKIIDIEVE